SLTTGVFDDRLIGEFERICRPDAVLHDPVALLAYECDALPHLHNTPSLVVLPSSTLDVQSIIRLCDREGIPFVARGHGSGLSGGALPVTGGVVIAMSRMNRILAVDIEN